MRLLLPALLLLAVPLVAQPAPQPMITAPAAPRAAAVPTGYVETLSPLTLLRLLPPPPVAGSSEDKADQFLYRESRKGILGPDWRRAQGQLGIGSADFVKAVSCALGAELTPKTAPATTLLLRRAGTDLAKAVFAAKDYYKRPRPFASDRGKACDPEAAINGGKGLGFAYPSGHAAVGWLWGLILSDLRPERSAALLKFGKDTGDLRIACRVHWSSDVTGGRLLATALYQQISDEADYKADLLKARAELTLAPVPEGCPAG
jgi:acid phosphatase (class A)